MVRSWHARIQLAASSLCRTCLHVQANLCPPDPASPTDATHDTQDPRTTVAHLLYMGFGGPNGAGAQALLVKGVRRRPDKKAEMAARCGVPAAGRRHDTSHMSRCCYSAAHSGGLPFCLRGSMLLPVHSTCSVQTNRLPT